MRTTEADGSERGDPRDSHTSEPAPPRRRVHVGPTTVKGLILAGGRGTRLRPITHTSAKQLVPVANKPILFYAIEQLVAVGITEIGVVTGETGAEIASAIGDGSRWGATVTYIDQGEPRGLADAVAVAQPFLGDDDFVMYLGDNLLQDGLAPLLDRFREANASASAPSFEHRPEPPAAHLLLSPVDDPQRFGVAEVEDGRIVRLVEKPAEPRSNLAMVGVYLFTSAIHEAVAGLEPSARGELEIVDAITRLIDAGHPVLHEVHTGWWLDTGKKDSLLEANRRVLDSIERRVDGKVDADSSIDGRVVIEEGAVVVASTVRGPAVIGARCRLEHAHIGPFTSIGPDATVVESGIENSVLLDHVQVIGVERLADSLIGRDSEVLATRQPPRATRLLIGDNCRLELPEP